MDDPDSATGVPGDADPARAAPVPGPAPGREAGEGDAGTTTGDRVGADPEPDPAAGLPDESGAGPEDGAGVAAPSPRDLVQAVADFVDDLVEDGDEPS